MSKPSELDQRILAAYELHDDNDTSIERLLQMVADDCGCDTSDVVAALRRDHVRNGGTFE